MMIKKIEDTRDLTHMLTAECVELDTDDMNTGKAKAKASLANAMLATLRAELEMGVRPTLKPKED